MAPTSLDWQICPRYNSVREAFENVARNSSGNIDKQTMECKTFNLVRLYRPELLTEFHYKTNVSSQRFSNTGSDWLAAQPEATMWNCY